MSLTTLPPAADRQRRLLRQMSDAFSPSTGAKTVTRLPWLTRWAPTRKASRPLLQSVARMTQAGCFLDAVKYSCMMRWLRCTAATSSRCEALGPVSMSATEITSRTCLSDSAETSRLEELIVQLDAGAGSELRWRGSGRGSGMLASLSAA